ncbi:hypothetical protein LTR36_009975 [Oleoguttula mirabilis]|uniref:Heterokaryon incompatibility domain-containing protein n=1 Tax=Oleoguttula mirabilis TaxID=1507867 RepID=A0AAV9J598_9PEZI|nr:hypothetical protein LTR36_009975 [Oleoguttula mirabilis]
MAVAGDLSAYVWQPLSVERKEIRLLVLEPAPSLEDDIRATLHTVSLLENPEYRAVSYAWGERTDSIDIWRHAERTPVRVSLHGALRRLRHATEPRFVWADAVCIDQKNCDERAAQAAEVLIWLGEDDTGAAELAFEYLRSLDGTDHNALMGSVFQGADGPAQLEPLWRREQTISDKYVRLVNSATRALGYNLAEGTPDLTASAVVRATQTIDHAVGTPLLGKASALDVRPGLSWLTLCNECRSLDCWDPRDRVFALLSAGNMSAAIAVDYEKPVEKVFTDAAHAVIEHSNALDYVLLYASVGGALLRVPSWVPDWTWRPTVFGVSNWIGWCEFFDASAGMGLGGVVPPLDGALVVRARLVCIVHLMEPSWKSVEAMAEARDPIADSGSEAAQSMYTKLEVWRHFLDVPPDVFWPVLFGGVWRNEPGDHRRLSAADCQNMEQKYNHRSGLFEHQSVTSEDWPTIVHLHPRTKDITPCRTSSGTVGMVPIATKVSDTIAILAGASVPFVLRAATDRGPNDYRLIGPAYVHGIMHGEAVTATNGDPFKEINII